MNIKEIAEQAGKPEIYKPGTDFMWTDEYISKQLLDIHINPDIDLASRKKSTIKSTINWILEKAPGKEMTILDLGCGPGLYTTILAQKDHKVTGIDISKTSVDYAVKQANEKQLNIEYRNQNYLELNEEDKYDLVILIYTDFGVLAPGERQLLLQKIKKALKPGGILVFDVLNDKKLEQKVPPKNWEIAEKGFWSDEPYIAFSKSLLYEKEKVILHQHIVMNENEESKIYRFWTSHFSHEKLEEELKIMEPSDIEFHENILPFTNQWDGENVTFCVVKL